MKWFKKKILRTAQFSNEENFIEWQRFTNPTILTIQMMPVSISGGEHNGELNLGVKFMIMVSYYE